MAIQATHGKVVVHMVSGQDGLSEVWNFSQTDFPTLVALGTTLCYYRRWFFGESVRIKYARASLAGPERNTKLIPLPYPLGFPNKNAPLVGPIDTSWVGLHYRFETANGRGATQIIRGIPDDDYLDGKYVGEVPKPLGLNEALADPTNNDNQNFLYLQRSCLRWLLTNTKHVRKLGTPENRTYDVNDWDRAVYLTITKRDVGRPFGTFRGRARKRTVPAA